MPVRDPATILRALKREHLPTEPTVDLVGATAQRVATSSLSGRYGTNIHLPTAAVDFAIGRDTDVAVYATPQGIVLLPTTDDPNEPILPVAGERKDGGGGDS